MQIAESPILLSVILPVCADPNMIASSVDGKCTCKQNFVIGGEGKCTRIAGFGMLALATNRKTITFNIKILLYKASILRGEN